MKKSNFILILAVLSIGLSPTAYSAGKKPPHQTVDYMIPVQNEILKPFATHQFDISWKNQKLGSRVFDYELPIELDGVGQEIILTETSPNQFEGEKATATCGENIPLQCTIKYKNLVKDLAAAENKIISLYSADPTVLEGRLAVMNGFQSDPEPGGILLTIGPVELTPPRKK